MSDNFCHRSNLPGPTTYLNDTARLSCSGLVKLSAFEQHAGPFAHALEGDVKRRDHEDPNGARSDHASENRRTDVMPTDLRGALGNQRTKSQEPRVKKKSGHSAILDSWLLILDSFFKMLSQ